MLAALLYACNTHWYNMYFDNYRIYPYTTQKAAKE